MVNYNFCEEIFILPLILILLVNINIVIQFDAWVCHFVMLCVCTQYFSCSNCYNYHRQETAGHQVKGKACDSPWSNVISIVWSNFFFFFFPEMLPWKWSELCCLILRILSGTDTAQDYGSDWWQGPHKGLRWRGQFCMMQDGAFGEAGERAFGRLLLSFPLKLGLMLGEMRVKWQPQLEIC